MLSSTSTSITQIPKKCNIIKQIKNIEFGIFSNDEIMKYSVCEIVTSKTNEQNSLNDPKLGVLENDIKCVTCGMSNKYCTGHFSYIELGIKIINPLYILIVLHFLKCFCFNCSSMLQTKDHLNLKGIYKIRFENKFKFASEILQKICICNVCKYEQPLFFENKSDKTIHMCRFRSKKKTVQKSQPVDIEDISRVFNNISSEELNIIGVNVKLTHPKNLIMSKLFVLPSKSRPYVITEGTICDDDLTIKYGEIIKCVNKLKNLRNDKFVAKKGMNKVLTTEEKKLLEKKYIDSIIFHISTLFDNSQQRARVTNDRAIKGFKQRMSGKDGQMRSHLMGKRVDQSGRCVIGGDPLLNINQIRLPRLMADNLTVPCTVFQYNIKELQSYVNKGDVNTVIKKNGTKINLKYAMNERGTQLMYGDIVIRNSEIIYPDSILTFELKNGDQIKRCNEIIDVILPKNKEFILEQGDIVQRKLRNNDYLLVNRQPTLHKGSMMASKIIIYDGYSIRLPLSVTKSYNADFDGDEMNVHNPISLPSRTELECNSEVIENIMNSQNAQPNITIVQDHLLMCFLMTYKWIKIDKDDFQQLCCGYQMDFNILLSKINHIKKIYKKLNEKHCDSVYNSKTLFSLVFPKSLHFTYENKINDNEPILKIRHGVIISGTINKSAINGTEGLISHIFKEYGKYECKNFIDFVNQITYQWIFYRGFSIGYSDCLVKSDNNINTILQKCYLKASLAIEEQNETIRELKITRALNEARDVGNNLSKKGLDFENNFRLMVASGAKGDFNNLAQIVGILGQQNGETGRLQLLLAHKHKALFCYPNDEDIDVNTMQEIKYESRGFVKSSYMSGLNPREFWSHCITGRNGLLDTSLKTADSGYMQRRMCKTFENIKIAYDHTVRGPNNQIIQFAYGGDAMNESFLTKTRKGFRPCNINRLINRINTQVEHNINSNKIPFDL